MRVNKRRLAGALALLFILNIAVIVLASRPRQPPTGRALPENRYESSRAS